MLPKALVLIVLIVIIGLGTAGCKKSSPQGGSTEDVVKTAAEYAEEAEREINADNMAEELKKIEAELDDEENDEP
ncbi:MAG: hypothetical protein ACYTFK_02675 [Planctomycetota bacterium]